MDLDWNISRIFFPLYHVVYANNGYDLTTDVIHKIAFLRLGGYSGPEKSFGQLMLFSGNKSAKRYIYMIDGSFTRVRCRIHPFTG